MQELNFETIMTPRLLFIIAALVKKGPSLVDVKPLVLMIVNVVSGLVGQSAAPASKASTGVVVTRLW